MLSARELEPARLPPNAQTWVNQHLIFTHGNGVVMSPVTQNRPKACRYSILRDIPRDRIRRPPPHRATYLFWAERRVLCHREGEYSGVRLSQGRLKRLHGLQWHRRDRCRRNGAKNPLRLVFQRSQHPAHPVHHGWEPCSCSVETSVIAFAKLPRSSTWTDDPYAVVSNGRLFWIQDAYTTSSWFPYAQPLPRGEQLNYIRNSVENHHRRLQRDG